MTQYLIVYKCTDNGEEKACFLLNSIEDAESFIAAVPSPLFGFQDRPGYYFWEEHTS